MKALLTTERLTPPSKGARKVTAQPVCAVIVTYHPSDEMLGNLSRVTSQVQGMVVVDNGSSADKIEELRKAREVLGFQLIENAENLGIAEGLNQGVRWARDKGYPWVILFDQDSAIDDGFVARMFEAWNSHPQRERVVSIHPSYMDPETGCGPVVRRARDGGPVISMTSGALMPVWIFDKIGGFASEYFIDWVDIEYCFRIRAAGYLIADSPRAILLHAPGHSETQRLLGFGFRPTHHSAMRRYYMSRNRIAVFRKYLAIFPRWILLSMYDSLRETVKCFIGERNRSIKFRRFVLGTWDGLTGRMGKRDLL
jgi:rhamnosyltransferase